MTRAKHHRVGIETLLLIGTLWLIGSALSGCTVSHQVMRGSVVAVMDNEAHICIGSHDGLKVGDTLTVYRTKQVGFPTLPYGPGRTQAEYERSYRYERVRVGKVRVTRIFDGHFAAVVVVTGEIDYPDIVERSYIP
ncbi:MAG: hypothetical protein AAB393_18260 [Bacteroidota bacterium]